MEVLCIEIQHIAREIFVSKTELSQSNISGATKFLTTGGSVKMEVLRSKVPRVRPYRSTHLRKQRKPVSWCDLIFKEKSDYENGSTP